MSTLARRVAALEARAGARQNAPCRGCGLGHLLDVLDIDLLAARHAGRVEPLPPVCGCPCCAAPAEAITARYERSRRDP